MLTRRLQILLDEDRYERLTGEARRRKVSIGELVRESIDVTIPREWTERATAGARILAAEPMDVPETVAELRAELDELRGLRG